MNSQRGSYAGPD